MHTNLFKTIFIFSFGYNDGPKKGMDYMEKWPFLFEYNMAD